MNVTGTSALSGPNQVSRIADSCFPTMARMNTHHSEEDMRSHRLSLIGLNSKRLSNRLDDGVPQNRMPATMTLVQNMVRVYTLQSINDQQLATLITLGGETIQVKIAGNPFEVTVNDICELANRSIGYGLFSDFKGTTQMFLDSDCLPGRSLISDHMMSKDGQLRPQFRGLFLLEDLSAVLSQ